MVSPNSAFHIFRDSRRQVRTADLVVPLRTELLLLSSLSLDTLLVPLLLAGELECALEDAQASAPDRDAASALTLLLAESVVACDSAGERCRAVLPTRRGLQLLDRVGHAGTLDVSTPEGFAYYALHPLDYSDLIARLDVRMPHAFVLGIRTIGTTLSAVVCAKLRQLGIEAERSTVRPTGHPYDRECRFDVPQRQAIARARAANAEFVVCDEGPGRSGSSLLSVAEALEQEGVSAGRILILCSHEPDVNALCAPGAAQRWSRYRCVATGMTRRLPSGADCYAGGGEWRRHLLAAGETWPAVWPQMERLQCVSYDHRELLTFAGHGPYGAAVAARNQALSDSGFGARYLGEDAGFACHLLPHGSLLQCNHLTPEMLIHMAEYIAWRARGLGVGSAESVDLREMVRTNFAREFGNELGDLELAVERPAVCDHRLSPQYWLREADHRILKLDAAIHGDDHFFPGPCDIAWDLAGIVVEWELSEDAREFLLTRYRHSSRDDAALRLHAYEIAYAILRLAWSRMAAASTAGTEEEVRLVRDAQRYRRMLERLTGYKTRRSPRPPVAVRLPQARGTSAAPEPL